MITRTRSLALLFAGTALITLSHMRWGIGLLAWFAPVPFLLFLFQSKGKKSRLLLIAALCLAWTLATIKIVTDPLPMILALGYGSPLGLIFSAGFLAWDKLRHRVPNNLIAIVFAAVMISIEWVQHRFTPFGTWGAAANSQLENLSLLQSVSLAGIAAIALPMYWFAALLAQAIHEKKVPVRQFSVLTVLLVSLHVYGGIRLGNVSMTEHTKVAAIGTDATFGGLPLPGPDEVTKVNKALFQRSEEAARNGAKLISWTEGATMTLPHDEAALIKRGQAFAAKHRVELVMSYIVPISAEPLKYNNKYVWIAEDGNLRHHYLKHEPVPGEPAVRGIKPPVLAHTAFGPATGAICYDYDFPYLGLENARLNPGLVVLPSSDWKGIDPIHTQMASVRAIEGGYSLLRPTRFGLSAAYDAKGRVRGWQSANEEGPGIMIANVPTKPVPTLYKVAGDWLVYLAIFFLVVVTLVPRLKNQLKR